MVEITTKIDSRPGHKREINEGVKADINFKFKLNFKGLNLKNSRA